MWCHNRMSSREKLEVRIRNNPRDVSLDDLLQLMSDYKFRRKETAEGYMFFHDALRGRCEIPRVANPHGRRENKVKKSYVLQCLAAIDVLVEDGR